MDFSPVSKEVLEHHSPDTQEDRIQKNLSWLPSPVSLDPVQDISNKPIDFTVDGLLIRGRAHLLTGLGGASKTTFLSQLAVGIACNRDVMGWNIRQAGDVVLLLAEDTGEDVQRLIHDILKNLHLSDDEKISACSRLHIFAAAGTDCTIIDSGNLKVCERLDQFISFCRELQDVRLIGLDPAIALSRSRELDEHGQRELANAVERIAIETMASVVLVSHAPKSVQYQNEIGSHYSRGSGALTDALRLEMLLRVMTSKESKSFGIHEDKRQNFVRFQITKANRLPPYAMKPRWFIRGTGGVLYPTEIEVSLESGERINEKEVSALQAFISSDEMTGEIKSRELIFSDWKSYCVTRKLVTGNTPAAQDTSARRFLNSLMDKNLVKKNEAGFWSLTDQGFSVASKAIAIS